MTGASEQSWTQVQSSLLRRVGPPWRGSTLVHIYGSVSLMPWFKIFRTIHRDTSPTTLQHILYKCITFLALKTMIVQNWWSASVQGGKPPAGWITNVVLIIFWASYVIYLYNIHWLLLIHCLSLSAYICPMTVTIGVYLSTACHYRRIFVHCLSLSA